MKKLLCMSLILVLILGCLTGCIKGKTALLLVEDTRTDQVQLLWTGFSAKAKKMGLKPILVGLTDENEVSYTSYQVWEQAVAEHNPHVLAIVGMRTPQDSYSFLQGRECAVVAINPDADVFIPDTFCINGATEVALTRKAAERIIEMEPPASGRIRLLYNRDNEEVEQIFVSMMEEGGYFNLECTPLSGRISEQTVLNSFSEDTVAAYNASDYDTNADNVSNFILSMATRPHLEALQADQACAIYCRDYETIGQQAADACKKALKGKEATVISVEPILITANGPDRSGAQYWLDLLG